MKTKIGYKLFEEDRYGNLFPLFIDKKNPVPVGEWVKAEFIPTKGFASRGGWHIGEIPDAPWLKSYDGTITGTYKSQRGKTFKRVWCVVQYNANHNYEKEVAMTKKKCFDDQCPEDGYYPFRECGKGTWIISSDIKIIGKLSEIERQIILRVQKYDETEAFKPYKEIFEKKKERASS